jgi:hypothetical protein
MHDVDLLEAWRLWGSGQPTADLVLWGLPILWWGRIGKLAQFAGALTVVLDLIGPARLRAWGRALHPGAADDRLRDALARTGRVAQLLAELATLPKEIDLEEAKKQSQRILSIEQELQTHGVGGWSAGWLGPLIWFISSWLLPALPAVLFVLLTRVFDPLARSGPVVGGILIVMVLLAGVVTALASKKLSKPVATGVYLIKPLLGIVIDFLLARPVAALLDTQQPGLLIKWLGVLLLVAGFHFDLLAS